MTLHVHAVSFLKEMFKAFYVVYLIWLIIYFAQDICAADFENHTIQEPQSLPNGWWQDNAPKSILERAQVITLNLPYLKASKAKMLDDSSRGFELFQRRTTDGRIETKIIRKRGNHVQSILYDVSSGRYFINVENGIPIKDEFESDDEIETRVAESISTPYEYEMLKSTLTGTNKCLVVRSKMSQEMINSLSKEFHKAMPNFNVEYIRTIKDFYIRENDGIIVGYIQRNSSGSIMGDRLADAISVRIPILPEEFLVPKVDRAIIANSLDSAVAIATTNLFMSGNPLIQNSSSKVIMRFALGIFATAPILGFLYHLRFRRRSV